MIILKSEDLTEKQLAEIAGAIQERWDLPSFVKKHEIAVDDALEDGPSQLELPVDGTSFEQGMRQIMENLEMTGAFELEKIGMMKFRLMLVDQSKMPTWMRGDQKTTPEGVFECGHCGKWFRSEFELNLHQKLHYIL